MSTYLLVHGGFTDSAYWGETAAVLRREGHRVLLAELPSTGTDPATLGGLAEDAAEVRRMLDAADEPVVLVGHSSGGMVITEVADHPAIAHTVYVGAFWPERGLTLLEAEGASGPAGFVRPTPDGSGRCPLCGLALLAVDQPPESHRVRDHPHPARPQLPSLAAQPDPTLTLAQMRLDRLVTPLQGLHDRGHSTDRSHPERRN